MDMECYKTQCNTYPFGLNSIRHLSERGDGAPRQLVPKIPKRKKERTKFLPR